MSLAPLALAATMPDLRAQESGAQTANPMTIDPVAASPATGDPGTIMLDVVTISGGSTIGDYGVSDGNTLMIVDRETIDTYRPTTVQDLFRGESSVTVGGTIATNQKIYVHGIEETNLAVSIDGSRQNNKIFHHNATTIIDPQLLKSVQVEAGVAAADAGPGALAGAILYETIDVGDVLKDGRNFGGFVDAGYDTNGQTFSKRGSIYGKIGGFESLLYLNGVDGENYDDGDGNEVLGSGASLLSGLGKIAFEGEAGDRVELSYERVQDDADRPYRANIGAVLSGRPVPETRTYDLDRQNVVLSYENTLATGLWDPRVVLAYSVTDLRTDEEPLRAPGTSVTYDGSNDSLNGKAENTFNLDMGTVTVGFDAYDDEAEFDGDGYRTSERARNVGSYAQARLQPLDRLSLSFGGRVDHQVFTGTDDNDQDNTGLSGNVSAEYQLTDWFAVKGGYSNVFGGIVLTEPFIMNPGWSYGDIDTARAENVFAGFVVRYEGLILDAQIFDTDINDGRVATYGGGPALVEDFSSKGVDIGLGYDWGTGFGQVKFTSVDTEIGGDVADSYLGNYFTTPIGDIVTVSLVHRFEELGLLVGGDAEYAFEEDSTTINGRALEDYTVVNLFTEYRPAFNRDLSLRAEVKNLFDEDYSDRATYGQDFVDVRPLKQPGRSFGISTRFQF
ncbi:TonB-dependent receptor [Aurantimonas endophytica]|nr:TonB-dependent receptor [Aurantimonas endophytica]